MVGRLEPIVVKDCFAVCVNTCSKTNRTVMSVLCKDQGLTTADQENK